MEHETEIEGGFDWFSRSVTQEDMPKIPDIPAPDANMIQDRTFPAPYSLDELKKMHDATVTGSYLSLNLALDHSPI